MPGTDDPQPMPATDALTRLPGRTDMTTRSAEAWRPPTFAPPASTPRTRTVATLRRFLDLQAGTCWRDLAQTLPACRGVIVDVGCGAQPYRGLLTAGATTYVGIDTTDAKAHFGYEVPDTRYFAGDFWPVADAEADYVLCTETMEHVPDTAGFCTEMARVLKPGGGLILTVPFSARFHYIPHDYWRFTPTSLRRVLEHAGFEDVAVYARGNAVTVACYKSMALVLPLLVGGDPSAGAARRGFNRLVGLLLSPTLVVVAIVANVSARGAGGDDCLGYTVLARRRRAEGFA